MNFRDPNYRKIDEEMRESYKRILGRDLDKDFEEKYKDTRIITPKDIESFEKFKKSYHSDKEDYLVQRLKDILPDDSMRKKKGKKSKIKRCGCK